MSAACRLYYAVLSHLGLRQSCCQRVDPQTAASWQAAVEQIQAGVWQLVGAKEAGGQNQQQAGSLAGGAVALVAGQMAP